MAYTIEPCRLSHIRRLAATLRAADRAEFAAVRETPRHALIRFWQRSLDPRVAIIDGEVAMCWGDAGDLLSREGCPWAFSAPPIETLPIAFAREARREIARMLAHRDRLVTLTHCDYTRARRFYGMLGFRIEEPNERGWCRMIAGMT